MLKLLWLLSYVFLCGADRIKVFVGGGMTVTQQYEKEFSPPKQDHFLNNLFNYFFNLRWMQLLFSAKDSEGLDVLGCLSLETRYLWMVEWAAGINIARGLNGGIGVLYFLILLPVVSIVKLVIGICSVGNNTIRHFKTSCIWKESWKSSLGIVVAIDFWGMVRLTFIRRCNVLRGIRVSFQKDDEKICKEQIGRGIFLMTGVVDVGW